MTLLSPIFLALGLLPGTADAADYFLRAWESHRQAGSGFRLIPQVGYYLTKNNFDTGSTRFFPSGFTSYNRVQTDLNAAWGIAERFTAYGRMSWGWISLEHATTPGNSFGFTDQLGGVTVRAWQEDGKPGTEKIGIDLQAEAEFPAYFASKARDAGVPVPGDASVDVTGGLLLSLPFAQSRSGVWISGVGFGYTYRTLDYSPGLPWSASLRYKPADDGIIAGVMVFGTYALRPNEPSGSGITGELSADAGGSFAVSAKNPSLTTVRGQLGYQITRQVAISATAAQSVWGQTAPNGFYAAFGLHLYWDDQRKRNARSSRSEDYEGSNKGFVDYAFEAHVMKSNDRLNLIKIDKGIQDGVEVGQLFDIFLVKQDGLIGEAVARAKVVSVKSTEAALSVIEYYKEVWIEEGFLAKRPLQ